MSMIASCAGKCDACGKENCYARRPLLFRSGKWVQAIPGWMGVTMVCPACVQEFREKGLQTVEVKTEEEKKLKRSQIIPKIIPKRFTWISSMKSRVYEIIVDAGYCLLLVGMVIALGFQILQAWIRDR